MRTHAGRRLFVPLALTTLVFGACSQKPSHPPVEDTAPPASPPVAINPGVRDAAQTDAAALADAGSAKDASPADSALSDATGADTAASDAAGSDATPPPFVPAQTGTFDPDRVYLVGDLVIGNVLDTNDIAVMDLQNPAAYWVGFRREKMQIRPDGRMISDGYVFEPDAISNDEQNPYPAMPYANDTALATPACSSNLQDQLGIFPDDGKLLYGCVSQLPAYVEGTSDIVYSPKMEIAGLGANRTLFLNVNASKQWALHAAGADAGGADTPVVFPEPDGGTLGAAVVRFVNGSFLVARYRNAFNGGLEQASQFTVALDGTVTKVGDYDQGSFAPGMTTYALSSGTLDKAGNLYAIFNKPAGQKQVVRFHIGAAPDILYTENATRDQSLGLAMNYADLVTGP